MCNYYIDEIDVNDNDGKSKTKIFGKMPETNKNKKIIKKVLTLVK